MVIGSRIGWPERSINLCDRALRVAPRALLELARVSSDTVLGWNECEIKYSVSRLHSA